MVQLGGRKDSPDHHHHGQDDRRSQGESQYKTASQRVDDVAGETEQYIEPCQDGPPEVVEDVVKQMTKPAQSARAAGRGGGHVAEMLHPEAVHQQLVVATRGASFGRHADLAVS